jgi:hypothetical protein
LLLLIWLSSIVCSESVSQLSLLELQSVEKPLKSSSLSSHKSSESYFKNNTNIVVLMLQIYIKSIKNCKIKS